MDSTMKSEKLKTRPRYVKIQLDLVTLKHNSTSLRLNQRDQ